MDGYKSSSLSVGLFEINQSFKFYSNERRRRNPCERAALCFHMWPREDHRALWRKPPSSSFRLRAEVIWFSARRGVSLGAAGRRERQRSPCWEVGDMQPVARSLAARRGCFLLSNYCSVWYTDDKDRFPFCLLSCLFSCLFCIIAADFVSLAGSALRKTTRGRFCLSTDAHSLALRGFRSVPSKACFLYSLTWFVSGSSAATRNVFLQTLIFKPSCLHQDVTRWFVNSYFKAETWTPLSAASRGELWKVEDSVFVCGRNWLVWV